MLRGQEHTKCFARPIREPYLIFLSVCILFIIKVYDPSSLPISKMKIMLAYLIYFGHDSILFCLLGDMLIKVEVLKFKLLNVVKRKLPNYKYRTRYIQQLYMPVNISCTVNERA